MVTIRKIRLHNPSKSAQQRTRSKAPKRGARRKTNPASLITLGFANPHKESKPMKRKKVSAKARKRNPVKSTVSHKTHRRRRNPSSVVVRRRRSNPSSAIGKTSDLAKNISSALVGLVVTRQAPQALLGANNTGLMGYGASLLTMIATAYGVSKFVGREAGHAALLGGGMQLATRLLNEYVSPIGKVLNLSGNIGDPHAASLGDIRESGFPLPTTTATETPWSPQVPKYLAPAPVVAPPASTVSGLGARTRFTGRFAA